ASANRSDQRPCLAAANRASPLRNSTLATPVSPPLRASTNDCSTSRPWKSYDSTPPPWIDTASSKAEPAGTSSSGRRGASGTELPAISGSRFFWQKSYISRAQSQRNDRCLSLNSGTNRFDALMTAAASSKKRLRGYSTWPILLDG